MKIKVPKNVITYVAVKTGNGKLYFLPAPNRHHNVLRLMKSLIKDEDRDYSTEIEGFLDEDGEFINRKEAYILALEHDQIDRCGHPPNSYNGTELYSEDLW